MLTLHHLRASQSDRILWLFEELGLPYELKCYDREPSMAAPPEYKALTPFGTAPTIADGDLVLGESGAIVEYVCHRHAGGRLILGPDHPDYVNYLYWFHFGNGSLVPAMMVEHVLNAAGAAPMGPSRTDRALSVIDARLAEAPYFAGAELTAADIMMCLPRLGERRDLSPYPHVRAYLDRVEARPAWQRTAELK